MTGKVGVEKNNVVIDGDLVTINSIPFATTAEMDIYVRAADGNDSNPGTSALPLATLIEAKKRIPHHVRHTVVIHVGPHTGNGYAWPKFGGFIMDANIWVVGDGGGGGTDGYTELLAATAALSGTNQNVIKYSGMSAASFGGFGEYWGATIEILTGDAAGDKRTVKFNTTTDLVPNYPFSAVVDPGDEFRIVLPEVDIYQDLSSYEVPPISGRIGDVPGRPYGPVSPRLFLENLNFTSNITYFVDIYSDVGMIGLFGIYSDKSVWMFNTDGVYYSGWETYDTAVLESVPSAVADRGAPDVRSYLGWGFALRGTGSNLGILHIGRATTFVGSLNVREVEVYDLGTNFELCMGSIWGGASVAVKLHSRAVGHISGFYSPIMIGSLTTTNVAFLIQGKGTYLLVEANIFGSDPMLVVKSTNDQLQCDQDAWVDARSLGSGYWTVNSTSGFGFKTSYHGMIKFLTSLPTVSAGAGDFSEDNGETARAMTELAVSGPVFWDAVHGTIYGDW